MTTPNTNPSDLDRAARALEIKLMEFCTFMEDDLETARFDGIVVPALNQLRAALLPRASGVPEAELRESFNAGVAWQKEMEAPPVAAPSGDALRYAAQFLVDRLEDFELDETNAKEMCRQYLGFVEPAIDRLKMELASPIASEPKDAGSGEGQELSMAEENRVLVDCCTDAAGNWCSSLTALRALHSRGYRITRTAPSGVKP